MVILHFDVTGLLNPDDFVTPFDVPGDEYSQEQYCKALELAQQANAVHIAVNDTWSAEGENDMGRWCCSSCEKLGYHRSTAELVRAWNEVGVRIILHRWDNDLHFVPEGAVQL